MNRKRNAQGQFKSTKWWGVIVCVLMGHHYKTTHVERASNCGTVNQRCRRCCHKNWHISTAQKHRQKKAA